MDKVQLFQIWRAYSDRNQMMPGILFLCRHALLTLICWSLWAGTCNLVAQESPTDGGSNDLQKVDALYQFSLSEGGDLPAIRRAQKMLTKSGGTERSPEEQTLCDDVDIESNVMRYRLLLNCHGALGQFEAAEQDGVLLVELARAGFESLPEQIQRENPIFAVPRDCQANGNSPGRLPQAARQ